jgi:DNA-directed RNA polymerase subunit M/transcription elongation factor TFIIS
MQTLESEPLALRVSVLQEWSSKSKDRLDWLALRSLEDACHSNRVQYNAVPRAIWT